MNRELSTMRDELKIGGTHPVMDAHRVQGRYLLPGLAYIDWLYQLLRKKGHDVLGLRLQGMSIYRPLTAPEGGDAAVRFDWAAREAGGWRVTVCDAQDPAVLYAQAEIVPAPPPSFAERLDLDHVRAAAERTVDLGEVYGTFRERGLVHGEFMQVRGTAYMSEGVLYADCVLGEVAQRSAGASLFHPALIDGSAVALGGAGAMWHVGGADDGASALFLPLFYESFHASALIQRRCIARVRPENVFRKNELRGMTIEFFDEEGRQVAALGGMTAKLVRDSAAPAQAAQPAGMAEHKPAPAAGAERFLRDLLASRLNVPAERLDSHAGYYELGLDSASLLHVGQAVSRHVGVELPPTLLFEHTTLAELAGHLAQHHPDKFDAAAAPSASPVAPRGTQRRAVPAAEAPALPAAPEAIAIVGIGGRYPKARRLDDFWRNLAEGVDAIGEIPIERWDHGRHFDPRRGQLGKTYAKWGGFIDGVDEFDPLFFNIAPRDAETLDPQERLFLQCVHETLENAGYTRETLAHRHRRGDVAGRIGVFVGVMFQEYQLYGAQAQALGQPFALGGNIASIANRVSYWCNFHGPSLAVDTMCSSSLTAIHLACRSIQAGDCDAAIAGGVNLSLHPNKYLLLSQGQFLSGEGRCASFGEGAEGYVPGEGVGAVLLKRLPQAIADGDCILGVIRGSAVNHGGKTGGYTVPSPVAQAGVIAQALAQSGVDPRTVSYVEAHGTGTSLGDPIEIAGLAKAFGEYTKETGYCAIGSAKSNIGHCESAAGIAGLTKVLLQMKHKTLAPSLHSDVLNPHIDFASTPFVVQRSLAPWDRPVIEGREVPRIAGISSFGAGGSNAHLIVQEYERPEPQDFTPGPALIVLSARTPDQLRAKAQDLLESLPVTGASLQDVAHTLQVGREAMDVRMGTVAASWDELREHLHAWLAGDGTPACREGRRDADMALAFADDELREAVDKWIARGKLHKLLDVWVRGVPIDWQGLHAGAMPRRIGLPTYPFARERYWIPMMPPAAAPSPAVSAVLHPLLHSNTSTMSGQRYSSRFTGDEFFLRDHLVQGRPILPGVAQLEMVREAVRHAAELPPGTALAMERVTFLRPAALPGDGSLALHVSLYPTDSDTTDFEVQGEDGSVCTQGSVVLLRDAPRARVPEATGVATAVPVETLYATYESLGLRYGPAMRGVQRLDCHDTPQGPQVHAQLSLHETLRTASAAEGFVLHPGVLDAALQASLGLALGRGEAARPALPFAIDRLEIHASTPAQARAWVRASHGRPEGGTMKFDVDMVDAQGHLCVRLVGFTTRVMEAPAREDISSGTCLLVPEWIAEAAPAGEAAPSAGHRVFVFDLNLDEPALRSRLPSADVRVMRAPAASVSLRYAEHAAQLLEALQTQAREPAGLQGLVQLVVPAEEDGAMLRGLGGLVRSAWQESPHLRWQVLAVPATIDEDELARRLQAEAPFATAGEVRWRSGRRESWRLATVEPREAGALPWKDGGVYLVTGGAGGLGLIFAQEIATSCRDATLVLIGRSELSSEARARLDTLPARIDYRQLDVGDDAALARLVAEIGGVYGDLNGVVHSAGVLRDSLLAQKTPAALHDVLHPKLAGTVALDAATRHLALDFFMVFSSLASVFGNVGQADYAAANGFLDAFAARRQEQVMHGERHGRTLSLNWPLWAEGGMQVSDAVRAAMRQRGLVPLATAAAMQALRGAWSLDDAQVVVLPAEAARATVPLPLLPWGPARAEHRVPASAEGGATQREAVEAALAGLVAEQLKMRVADVRVDAPLESFGFDSVSLMAFGSALAQRFGVQLSHTAAFEHPTLRALTDHLLREHAASLARHAVAPTSSAASPAPVAPRRTAPRKAPRPPAADTWPEPIAIIGMSGRYPGADTPLQLWDNLVAGRDAIAPLPDQRWPLDGFYAPDREQALQHGLSFCRHAGWLDALDHIDLDLFGLTASRARFIGPKDLLLLETVWTLLESAGYTRAAMRRQFDAKVGVYVGSIPGTQHYFGFDSDRNPPLPPVSISTLAHRISDYFDFRGPSVAVDTQSASSAVAVHMACEALRHGECHVAVAAGVCVLYPELFVGLAQVGALGSRPDSRSFTDGDGLLLAEGAGAVLLKPLSRAEADGDEVLGVIRSSGVRHAGHGGLANAPNLQVQAELFGEVMSKAGVDARSIGHVEAAAYGSPIGDAIELAALTRAFRQFTGEAQFCALGSVKSHIGHAEAASGMSQLIKVVLQQRHGRLLPLIGMGTANPRLDLAGSPFYLPDAVAPWPQPEGSQPRRALVNSVGAGGAYASLLVEGYAAPAKADTAHEGRDALPVLLSARNPGQLVRQAEQLLAFAVAHPSTRLTDLAYTLQVGREPMEARLALLVRDLAELTDGLGRFIEGCHEGATGVLTGSARDRRENAADGDTESLLIDVYLKERRLSKLAECWVNGSDVDWALLHDGAAVRRLSLPTYPFDRRPLPATEATVRPLTPRERMGELRVLVK